MRYLTVVLFPICILVSSHSFAAAGDQLIITENIVNLRSGPSTNSDTLIKLSKDRQVTEIQRQQEWVEIKTHRDDIKTGWVHKSLLTKSVNTTSKKISKNTSSPTRFDKFMQRFKDHNEVLKKQNSVIYFSEVKDNGQGQIDVIATDAWINAEQNKRGTVIQTIFKLWSNVVPVGKSMSVRIFDAQGEQHMLMVR